MNVKNYECEDPFLTLIIYSHDQLRLLTAVTENLRLDTLQEKRCVWLTVLEAESPKH